MSENKKQNIENLTWNTTPRYLFLVLMAGFVLILIGMLVFITGSMFDNGSSSSSVVVVFVGPVPIVFGASYNIEWIVLGSLIIAALSLLAFIFIRRKVG